jgi:hypothetical protein
MTQFTCKGVKQINNPISLNRISRRFSSAREFQMGEFPEILIAKCRSRFYCTWFFSCVQNFVGGRLCGRKRCAREINVSSAGDPVHAGDKTLTQETPAQRGRINRYDIGNLLNWVSLWLSWFVSFISYKWYFNNITLVIILFDGIWISEERCPHSISYWQIPLLNTPCHKKGV